MTIRMECKVCGSKSYFCHQHPDAKIYRCKICTHCFSILDENIEDESYSPTYFEETHKNWFENPNYSLFKKISGDMISNNSQIKVLDVGCGNQDFLKYLRRNYDKIDLTGIDFSNQKEIPGIKFIRDDFLTFESKLKYDIVYSIMTIEHIDDVSLFSEKIYSYVKPGGTLILTTINENSILYRCALIIKRMGFSQAFNRLYSKHHINHFTPKSLAKLLMIQGFENCSFLWHNVPLKSLDIPAKTKSSGLILKLFVYFLFLFGRLTKRTYCQTIIAIKPN